MEKIDVIRLGEIAYARSGDKGSSANIGVIAYTDSGYLFLQRALSAQMVDDFFRSLEVTDVTRFELPNLAALNFVLSSVLAGGGSRSLRVDAQGKALGQALLELNIPLDVPVDSSWLPLERRKS